MKASCLYCGLALKKDTRRMKIGKNERPTIYGDVWSPEDSGRAIKEITKFKAGPTPDYEIAVCWLGDYKGYGKIDGVTAFCSLRCGTRFGLAAAMSGYRITSPMVKGAQHV